VSNELWVIHIIISNIRVHPVKDCLQIGFLQGFFKRPSGLAFAFFPWIGCPKLIELRVNIIQWFYVLWV